MAVKSIKEFRSKTTIIKNPVMIGGSGGSGDSGGSIDINGIVQEYKVVAGENINAGDFVEFLGLISQRLDTANNSCRYAPSCVLLEDNKVFIAHAYGDSYYLYGTIVEIDGTTINVYTQRLNSTSRSCQKVPSCVLLEKNKVFIAHAVMDSTNKLYGTIVEINGTTMTATSQQLNANSASCYTEPDCILVDYNKVFIAHGYGSTPSLYGTTVEIDGTTMTTNSEEIAYIYRLVSGKPACVLLENNKIFVGYTNSTNRLIGAIVEIDGIDIKKLSNDYIFEEGEVFYGPIHAILLENNKVFVTALHASPDSPAYVVGAILEIDGTNITATFEQLYDSEENIIPDNCVLLENNKVFFMAHNSNNNRVYRTIVEIDGTTIKSNTLPFSYNAPNMPTGTSCVLLESNKVFMAYGYSNTGYFTGSLYYVDHVKPYENRIDGYAVTYGVAKTGGSDGDTIEVYMPNIK